MNYECRVHLIGERIKKEREAQKLNKKDLLAKIYMAETSHKTLTAWENGERVPDLGSLARMAEVFQCDIGYLIGDYNERTRTTADIVKETQLSESAVQNILYMKNYDFTALMALSAFLETYIPKPKFEYVSSPDRDSAAGAVLGYIGMPNPSGILALSPDGTTVISAVNGNRLLPESLAVLQISLSDASRMVLHEKILKRIDTLREENGGRYQSLTKNLDLVNMLSQEAYDTARQRWKEGKPDGEHTGTPE